MVIYISYPHKERIFLDKRDTIIFFFCFYTLSCTASIWEKCTQGFTDTSNPHSGALNLQKSHTSALQFLGNNAVNPTAVAILSEMDSW